MNAEEIFHQALARPPDQRPAFLAAACASDEPLQRRVQALLRAHDSPGSFLAQQPPALALTVDHPISERPGTVIGPYKLMEQIGEGGMGLVFVAEQQQPIRRKVALKVIKPGMDTRQVVARFEAERQALALMDHPNIAKVLDGGTTDSRRPYFVMELVKGMPITEYCDQNQVSIRERLELFVSVCQAVQHAHQKGIIHRDLKPSNVLITLHDGTPVVKVIDFGVAKAIGQQLTDKTIYTQFSQMVGTPLYMSPEQAWQSGLDVDTRSDIYSLGVLLYELLTGTTPFDRERMRELSYDEMRRIIREEEPPKPSTRISTMGKVATTVSTQRQSAPKQLSRLIRGELDWIVMKALEKDRDRRYETANGFAMDVQRYLADEPVLACPPSAGYRLRKLIRRNKGPIAAASLVLSSMLAGTVVSVWLAVRADQQRRIAQTREAETKAVLDFLEKKVLAAARPEGQAGGLGHDVTLRQAIEAALPLIEISFKDQPLIEARLRATAGSSFICLGEFKTAAAQFQQARTIYTQHLGPDHPDTLDSVGGLATCYGALGRYSEAFQMFDETLVLMKAKLGPDHPDTLITMSQLALSHLRLRHFADAAKLNEETLALRKARLGPDHPDTLLSMSNLADTYAMSGRHAEALKLNEQTLALRKAKIGPDHPDTLQSMSQLAEVYTALGRHADALQLHQKTLTLRRAKLGRDHPDTLMSMRDVANRLQTLGRHADALKLREEALPLLKTKLGIHHPHTLWFMNLLADNYAALGRHADALKLYEETLVLMKAKLEPDHPDTLLTMSELALSHMRLGHFAVAAKLKEETLALRKARLGPDHPDTLVSMHILAVTYAALGRHADALKLHEETLARRKAKLGPDHPDTALSMNNLAWLLATCPDSNVRNTSRAVELAKKAVELAPNNGGYWNTLGVAHYRGGDGKAAVAALEKSMALRKGGDSFDWFFLAMAHWQQGDKEEARKLYRRAVEWMQKNKPNDEALRRFRAEAAELLSMKE